MRKELANLLFEAMDKHTNVYLITADLGYGLWDKIRDTYPDRFINVGSSEMAMMGMAIGLAMDGKIPFVYSITPFALYRPFEMIRNYINHERIPVKILGGGRDKDYGHLGFSHWAEDDISIMVNFENIRLYKPTSTDTLQEAFKYAINRKSPVYINLQK